MEWMKFPPDMFGSAEFRPAHPTKRAGSDRTRRMSQLQDERWKPVTDYVSRSERRRHDTMQ